MCNKPSVLYVGPNAWQLTVMEIFVCSHCDGTLIWSFVIVLNVDTQSVHRLIS